MASLGVINKQYVSALDPIIDTREINKYCTDVQNNDFFADILWVNGYKKVIETGQSIYNTFYNEDIVKVIDTTASSVSNSGTPVVTITGIAAAYSGYTQPEDMLMLVSGARSAIVQSVVNSSGLDTIVIKSVDGGNIVVTAGQILSIYSNAYGQQSNAGQNVRYGVNRSFNKWQILRKTCEISDVQKAATIEVEFNGQPYYTFKDMIDKKIALKININAAFIGGTMSDTTFSDANPRLTDQNTTNGTGGGAVQTTQGINKYIEAYGTALNTDGTVSFGALDDAQDNLLAKRYAMSDIWVVGSSKARRKYDVFLKNLGSAGVNSVRLNADAAGGSSLDFVAEQFQYGRYQHYFVTMPMLDDKALFANTVIAKSVYWLPKDSMVKVYGGGEEPGMRVRYVPHGSPFGSYDALIGETHDGALNPVNPTGTQLYSLTDYFTKQGLEWLNPQHGLRQQIIN